MSEKKNSEGLRFSRLKYMVNHLIAPRESTRTLKLQTKHTTIASFNGL